MKLSFSKYQGTGNDFILIDNRNGQFSLSEAQITFLCHRKFGIGSDGLMLIEKTQSADVDFRLQFYNPDASQSFCGNGSRCAVAFAQKLGIGENHVRFAAFDGLHKAEVLNANHIALHMNKVNGILEWGDAYFLNTGSPHIVKIVDDVDHLDVLQLGAAVRFHQDFSPGGTNVNFVSPSKNGFKVRTYERGVENETLSCGTGVTAVALAMHHHFKKTEKEIQISTPGGELKVSFECSAPQHYKHVILSGPASFVFDGEINI